MWSRRPGRRLPASVPAPAMRRGPRRALPSARLSRTAVRQVSLPPSPRSAACSLPGLPARRSARWCRPVGTGDRAARPGSVRPPASAPPLYDADAVTGPGTAVVVAHAGGSVPGRSRAAVPSYVGPGPAGVPLSPARVRSAAPAATRRHAVPVGLTACRQVPDRSPPFSCPGVLPPPREAPARVPPAVPSASAGHPADSPSYAFKRNDPPRYQQLFPDFFQDLFPALRARRFRR